MEFMEPLRGGNLLEEVRNWELFECLYSHPTSPLHFLLPSSI